MTLYHSDRVVTMSNSCKSLTRIKINYLKVSF